MLPIAVHDLADRLIVDNNQVSLTIVRATGRFSLKWTAAASIRDAYGEAKLANGTVRRTDELSLHDISSRKVTDKLGEGVEVVVRHHNKGQTELRQVFWVYTKRPEVMVRLDLMDASKAGSNRLTPLVTDRPVQFTHQSPLQNLFVPYDNDSYFRYNSIGWGDGEGASDGSYEVGAIYDDQTRHGLVIGSIDHDLWKSGIRFYEKGGVRAVAGVASKFTHDHAPHGTVTGPLVKSPRFVVGLYTDWRRGLERYGDLNAKVKPPLAWKGSVPFGWNSWSGHKSKVTAKDADAALDFVAKDLPWFRSGNTAYVNFDSFWDNLTREQRVDFCKRVHAAGLKAGIYWTPFVNWGEPDWNTSGGYKFRDLQLKNAKGELLPKLSGGWPLDPTHPGTLLRIDENIKDFLDQGFDYIKFDFMTHGALEGQHYDPKITTGTAAYALGMKRILDRLKGHQVFVSLSIAPMFPHGYAHARRISCDVFSNIGASEYFLNSQNYGWWTGGRLYQFNDPDSACVYQALGEPPTTDAEARTRFTASVIGGGMMIEGDDLTKPAARDRVLKLFSNKEALELARKTPAFRPVDGDTWDHAGSAFIYQENAKTAYVALFNFSKTDSAERRITLSRLGLTAGEWTTRDLLSGKKETISHELNATLAPMDCALIRITRVR